MKSRFFLLVILALVACRKNSEQFSLTGKFVDDLTGEPVTGSGVISVDGDTWSMDTSSHTGYEEEIGSGLIDSSGRFSACFKPRNSEHYIFWIRQTNKSQNFWYPDNIMIDRNQFVGGRKDTTVRLPRLAALQINFHNTTPFDSNDRLLIYAWSNNCMLSHNWDYKWENLQNCEIKNYCVYGGVNARGTLKTVVASDRTTTIYWDVMKNGIRYLFQDTVVCPRNIITTYEIIY